MMVPDTLINALIAFGIFLIAQAGLLIWFLSRINSELKAVKKSIAKVTDIENRLTVLETRCYFYHKNGDKKK